MAKEPPESSRDIAERAASALGLESGLFENLDAAGFGGALAGALRSSLSSPAVPARAAVQLGTDLAKIPMVAAFRWFGRDVEPPVAVDPKDRRFADPAWNANPVYYSVRLGYLAACRFARDVVGGASMEADAAKKAALALGLLLDALAPTNFLPTNPAALKRAFDTGGASVAKGARHFLDDLVHNGGKPRQVDTSGFEVGGNLAATPSKVVYRNELMELLQYEPQTPKVHAAPLLCSPPWINKYYVMDLSPGRSFIEWAVQHGRTVFTISYRNPTRDMSGTTMDDYMIHGPQTALDVIQDITGAETIDIVGLCLGGTLTAITAAYLTRAGDSRVGTLTLINTMLDYSEPGVLGTFTDDRTVARLEKKMKKEGTLEVGGRVIDLSAIKSPTYVVSAINDHIVPWESAYKTTALVSGPVRFVLSSGGHIAGIVSPPGPKAWHLLGKDTPASAADWHAEAKRQSGSWWEDWATWSAEHSGPMGNPPPMGSKRHPVMAQGPGEYIRT